MGIFPPGSFVKLATMAIPPSCCARRVGQRTSGSEPDLGRRLGLPDPHFRNTAKPEFKVVATVPRSNVMLHLDRKRLFGYQTN